MTSQATASTPDEALDDGHLPVLLHVEDWVDYFAEYGLNTVDELETALGRVGRDNGPELLADLYRLYEFEFPEGLLAPVIGGVWSGAEYPDALLDHRIWRRLFEEAGYTVDGRPEVRPPDFITLWRGSVPERRRDWSWTASHDVALDYANGAYRRLPGKVWGARVEPWRLLARNTERGEDEYVVDTRGLTIREAPKAPTGMVNMPRAAVPGPKEGEDRL